MGVTRSTDKVIEPVVKTVKVGLPVEAAFHLFTAEIHRWWPLASHSVGGDHAVSCVLEGKQGGRFYEMQTNGHLDDWGEVKVWEPPHRLVFSMHPGRTPLTATEVEVTFAPEGQGSRVVLTHRNWEILGDRAGAQRTNYDHGWETVLKGFKDLAGLEE